MSFSSQPLVTLNLKYLHFFLMMSGTCIVEYASVNCLYANAHSVCGQLRLHQNISQILMFNA